MRRSGLRPEWLDYLFHERCGVSEWIVELADNLVDARLTELFNFRSDLIEATDKSGIEPGV